MSLRWFGRLAGPGALVSLSLGLAQPALAHPRVVPVPVVAVAPRPVPVIDPKAAILARADGQQAGTLRWMDRDTLVLNPYVVAADATRLALRRDTPVFAGQTRLSLDSLRPGADVRVAYDRKGWGRPVVVAIELLNPDEARLARRQGNPPRNEHWRSHEMQPGRVLSLQDGWLTYDPYQRRAGDSRLRFDRHVPIFADGERVGPEALTYGTDVKVYFEGNHVVAIELPSRREARELRERDSRERHHSMGRL